MRGYDLKAFYASFKPGASQAAVSAPHQTASSPPMVVAEPMGPDIPGLPPIPDALPPNPPAIPQPPAGLLPPGVGFSDRSLGDLDEDERKRIFGRLQANDRMLQRQEQHMAVVEQSGGAPESMLQQMRDSLERMRSSMNQGAARSARISESDLEAIRREGEEKGW